MVLRLNRQFPTSKRHKPFHDSPQPNGKIYVGMDLTGTLTHFGSPSTVWPHSRHVQVVCPLP